MRFKTCSLPCPLATPCAANVRARAPRHAPGAPGAPGARGVAGGGGARTRAWGARTRAGGAQARGEGTGLGAEVEEVPRHGPDGVGGREVRSGVADDERETRRGR